jgi:hypothetical protein
VLFDQTKKTYVNDPHARTRAEGSLQILGFITITA